LSVVVVSAADRRRHEIVVDVHAPLFLAMVAKLRPQAPPQSASQVLPPKVSLVLPPPPLRHHWCPWNLMLLKVPSLLACPPRHAPPLPAGARPQVHRHQRL